MEDETKEIWKQIEEEEFNSYSVSNFGRVRNKNGKILKPQLICGYLYCVLRRKNRKNTSRRINRLVALAFCDGYKDGYVANHIDHNRLNNRADNLEWCDRDYNMQYGTWVSRNQRLRPVAQFSLDGKFIKEYKTIREASRETGIRHENIRNCAAKQIINKEKGYYTKSAGGYKWEFVDK